MEGKTSEGKLNEAIDRLMDSIGIQRYSPDILDMHKDPAGKFMKVADLTNETINKMKEEIDGRTKRAPKRNKKSRRKKSARPGS